MYRRNFYVSSSTVVQYNVEVRALSFNDSCMLYDKDFSFGGEDSLLCRFVDRHSVDKYASTASSVL
jgi:hypothetical protein